MTNDKKTELFETMSIPKAVATLAVPTILSSLVMVLYNLADTYFVGMLNSPVDSAEVILATAAVFVLKKLFADVDKKDLQNKTAN